MIEPLTLIVFYALYFDFATNFGTMEKTETK